MEYKKKVVKNIIYSFVAQIVTILLGILLPRLFITTYGSEINGFINSINQVFIYLSLLEAGIGLSTTQALYCPIAEGNQEKINVILSTTNKYYFKTGIYYFILLFVFAITYPLLVKANISYGLMFSVILLSGLNNVINFLFQGKYKLLLQAEGKGYIISNCATCVSIATNIVKIILINLNFNILAVTLGAFVINIAYSLYVCYYIKYNYKWLDINRKPDYSYISQKNSVLVHQISGIIFQNTDILILTIFCDLKVVSVYSMYRLLISMISTALSNITSSVLFILGQVYSRDINRYKFLIDIYDTYYTSIAFALYAIVYIMITPFLSIYTQGINDISYIDKYLPLLFIIAELLSVMRNAMLNTISVAGHFKKTLPQTIIESIINLIVSIIGVMLFGIYGVLMGTIVALIYRTNDIILYANKQILNRSSYKSYIIYITNIVLFWIIIKGAYIPNVENYIGIFKVTSILLITILPLFVLVISFINYKQTISLIRGFQSKYSRRYGEYS